MKRIDPEKIVLIYLFSDMEPSEIEIKYHMFPSTLKYKLRDRDGKVQEYAEKLYGIGKDLYQQLMDRKELRKRVKVVLASARGKSGSEINRIYGVSSTIPNKWSQDPTVRDFIERYEGISGKQLNEMLEKSKEENIFSSIRQQAATFKIGRANRR